MKKLRVAESVEPGLLLELLGIAGRREGREVRARCPAKRHVHGTESGGRGGSWSIRLEGDGRGRHHCFACGFGGGPVVLVAEVLGISGGAAVEWIERNFRARLVETRPAEFVGKVPPPMRLRYPEGSIALWPVAGIPPPSEVAPAVAYLARRGIEGADLERYRVAAVPEWAPSYGGRVIVPVVVDGTMVDFVARLFVEREGPKALGARKDLGARKEFALWGIDHVPDSRWVVVVEGVWGAVAVRRALGEDRAVAACGSGWTPERTELLRRFERVVVVPDGDAAGRRMGKSVRAALPRAEVIALPDGAQPDTIDILTLDGIRPKTGGGRVHA